MESRLANGNIWKSAMSQTICRIWARLRPRPLFAGRDLDLKWWFLFHLHIACFTLRRMYLTCEQIEKWRTQTLKNMHLDHFHSSLGGVERSREVSGKRNDIHRRLRWGELSQQGTLRLISSKKIQPNPEKSEAHFSSRRNGQSHGFNRCSWHSSTAYCLSGKQ